MWVRILGGIVVLMAAGAVSLLFMRSRLDRLMTRDWAGLRLAPGEETFEPLRVAEAFEETTFGGYRVPSRIRLTSKVGTPEENPFFEATLVAAEYQ